MEEIKETKGSEEKERSKKDLNFKDMFNTRGKRGTGYVLLTCLILYVFAILFTGSMEYYMTDAKSNFFPMSSLITFCFTLTIFPVTSFHFPR